MIARLLGAVLLASVVLVAQEPSQPPAPRTAESERPQRNEQPERTEPEPEVLIGTESAPAVVRIAKSQEEAAQEQADRQQEARTQWWTIRLTVAIAFFTGLLVLVGWKQRQTYEAQLATTRIIERAWLSLDTLDVVIPPQGGVSAVRISLHNSGRMPARIVGANITVWANSPLPPVQAGSLPSYDESSGAVGPPPTLLVANETTGMWFQLTQNAISNSTHIAALHSLTPGAHTDLWIYGYVHYKDDLTPKTERRYRWARRYSPLKTVLVMRQTNVPAILFEHENEPGYNYAD